MDIVPILYNSYLFPGGSYIHGRMLKGSSIPSGSPDNYWFTNVRRTVQLFSFQAWEELEGICKLAGLEIPFQTDKEGYFEIQVPKELLKKISTEVNRWEPLRYVFNKLEIESDGKAIVTNPETTPLGLITDIDDTVLKTDVRNKKRTIWHALAGNAYRKRVIEGAAGFVRSFQDIGAPVFYVTRSPYELYPRLCKVFDLNDFPSGPLLMRRYDRDGKYANKDYRKGQKIRIIRKLIEDSKPMRWLLVGDSSESDTSIYLDIAKDYPDQIAAIYIRLADRKSAANAFEQRKSFHSPVPFAFFGSYFDLPSASDIAEGRL